MSWDYGDLLGRAPSARNAHGRRQGKVFGIGLSRTGTMSLHIALEKLGYGSIHYPPLDRLFEFTDKYDAASDIPVACRYKVLDRRYPGARFVLTVRDIDKWLESTRTWYKGKNPKENWRRDEHRILYGPCRARGPLPWGYDMFRRAYERHVAGVNAHFAGREKDLLVLDITAGEGWEKLCAFLKRPVPRGAFPHEHNRHH